MKITTNQSYHSFNLTLDINRLESSGSSELVDLVTFSLPLDHVLESVTFNSMSHDLADINYKINGKLKQFQIPVKLLPQNNTLNLIYKQPQSLNLSSYSFHISSNTQKTRSDQTLNVLYEYPNSLAISGFTRQVEVIPGGLIFEMNSKQPGFGVIFKEP